MRRLAPIFAALLILASPALAQEAVPQTLQQKVEAVLATAPAGTRFGLLVTGSDGREIVAIDPDRRFIPASNTKLFTTAGALALLAPKEATAKPGTEGFGNYAPGALIGLVSRRNGAPDVVLYGRGDARMSGAPADCKVDCLADLANLIAQRTQTVHDIIGDDSWFPDQRWSPGMSWNNIGTDSGTAISALSLDDNELPIVVTPAATGQPPKVELSPA